MILQHITLYIGIHLITIINWFVCLTEALKSPKLKIYAYPMYKKWSIKDRLIIFHLKGNYNAVVFLSIRKWRQSCSKVTLQFMIKQSYLNDLFALSFYYYITSTLTNYLNGSARQLCTTSRIFFKGYFCQWSKTFYFAIFR